MADDEEPNDAIVIDQIGAIKNRDLVDDYGGGCCLTTQPVNWRTNGPARNGGKFLCGVVEGFYGRPWTPDQRKDLFVKMNRMGMNSYLYAPKDDCKHRMQWRDLYSVEEAEQLTSLIEAAKANNVVFYYALSPGLDVTYSSAKEVACLRRKLEQVAQFGCTAFALLFDDIEPEMCEADKEAFHSFAQAQVSVTNEIYQHLGQPDHFLFCPTEYCSTRAVPSVVASEYLNTVGVKLLTAVDVMWTGSRVITKELTVESIGELCSVLRRPPVIWDNLHANDYDQRRVFLGPFSGRSPDLIPQLRGLLTNPNCEYEVNHVAIHTIAAWSRCSIDAAKLDPSSDGIGADIRLETESDSGSVEDIPSQISKSSYHPRAALRAAIGDWLPEFYRFKSAPGQPTVCVQPIIGAGLKLPACVNTCITSALTTTTTTTTANATAAVINSIPISPIASSSVLPAVTLNNVATMALFQPVVMNPIMNSLVPPPPASSLVEPMDCIPPKAVDEQSTRMLVDADGAPKRLRFKDIQLLVDLFYLPFEYGSQALVLLNDFHWLKNNVHVVIPSKEACPALVSIEVQEWRNRAAKFDSMTKAVDRLYRRVMAVPNRSLAFELYPYVWDVMMALQLLNSYVKWLALGHVPQQVANYVQGPYSWFSHGWKETFTSGEQEPWMFRGGLSAELQRLLPVENINDLCAWKAPDSPSNNTYSIRPYSDEDKCSVYDVCLRTCDDGLDGTHVFPGQPELIGDKLVGSFLLPGFTQFCFVLEDEETNSVCGYALAALDAKQFYNRFDVAYIPHLHAKYPLRRKDVAAPSAALPSPGCTTDASYLLPAEEVIAGFHNYKVEVPEPVYEHHPSLVRIGILPAVSSLDPSLVKKLLSCALAALKANGSRGVYCEIHVGDKSLMDFYTKIGFVEIGGHQSVQSAPTTASQQRRHRGQESDEVLFFGRTF